jgi:hypothetical protein
MLQTAHYTVQSDMSLNLEQVMNDQSVLYLALLQVYWESTIILGISSCSLFRVQFQESPGMTSVSAGDDVPFLLRSLPPTIFLHHHI